MAKEQRKRSEIEADKIDAELAGMIAKAQRIGLDDRRPEWDMLVSGLSIARSIVRKCMHERDRAVTPY